jgi:parallel beta-helix repeat protein
MNKCGLRISHSNTMNFYYQNIDITNLINGKSLYYYTNEQDLGPNNFTNAGQIIMASCSNSLVTNLNLSYSDTGLTLINCDDIIITRNSINNNRRDGIYIFGGDNNTISENSVSYNNHNGVFLELNTNNSFLENNISYNDFNGFYCYSLENSFISGNDINHNQKYGIYFINCKKNMIRGNLLIGNEKCFNEEYSEDNVFENNECRDRTSSIPGYNLFLLLGILSILAIILNKKIKKSSFKTIFIKCD